MGLACGADDLLLGYLASVVVGDDLDFSWLILRVHPHQAVTLLTSEVLEALGILRSVDCDRAILTLTSLTLAVDEELRLGVARIDEDGGHLTYSVRPSPVGQDVQRGRSLVPVATIEIEAILGDTR